ncbi:MAG: S8 family serine peptidase [Aliidongia sp.]
MPNLTGWTTEIALDIQSAHAIAPGAKIVEVASAGQDDEDLVAALEYILTNHVATIVSNSWEADPEFLSGAAEEQAFAPVLQRMAAAGIAVQFSSGDSGDFGLGTPVGAVSVPSNSPYVTAVGGTSILNDPLGSGDIFTGWGTNTALIEQSSNRPRSLHSLLLGRELAEAKACTIPSPRGRAAFRAKAARCLTSLRLQILSPEFQSVVTSGGVQFAVLGIGGTSLASPLFSGIWAVAQQYNHATLGQAAPTVAG